MTRDVGRLQQLFEEKLGLIENLVTSICRRRYLTTTESRDFRSYVMLKLIEKVAERMCTALNDLQVNPRPPGAKKLTGQESYRIRKGDYRILYTIDDRARLVRVYRIGHRRDVYRVR